MSKFKVGDRVRVRNPASTMCAAGDVGVVIGVQTDGVCVYREGIDNIGTGWWLAHNNVEPYERPTHLRDPQPPVTHHDRVVADTHAAIDRLVAHLERQATEHVHALDALRAEVEALRTQNAHLRALQAAQEAKRFIVVETPPLHDAPMTHIDFKTEPKPVREVVRGTYEGRPAIAQPGHKPGGECGRTAIGWEDGWSTYIDGNLVECQCLTEPEAIAWVLDGVLPTR